MNLSFPGNSIPRLSELRASVSSVSHRQLKLDGTITEKTSVMTASRRELGTRDLAQRLPRLFRDGRFWINTDRLFELRAGPGSIVELFVD